MALGKNKKSKKGKKKGSGLKRYVASVWANESKDGDEFLSIGVDNPDPNDEYYKGNLIWYDAESETYYKIKSMSLYDADKGPDNLTNKLVLDLENEYHVEEME